MGKGNVNSSFTQLCETKDKNMFRCEHLSVVAGRLRVLLDILRVENALPGHQCDHSEVKACPRPPPPRMDESLGELSTKEITGTRMIKQACTLSGRWPGCRQLSSGAL